MNIECNYETLRELETSFKFNDAILRYLTVRMKKAETGPSPMMKSAQKDDSAKNRAEQDVQSNVAVEETAEETANVSE